MLHRAMLCLLFVMLVVPAAADGQGAAQKDTIAMVAGKTLKWGDLDLPGFAKGLQLAPVHGDPAIADAPYTIRLKFPAGYAFPAHYHPKAENLTVLSGTFQLGHGAKADPAGLRTYVTGDFLHIPATMPHYGQVKGETVIQLNGVGPFEVILAK